MKLNTTSPATSTPFSLTALAQIIPRLIQSPWIILLIAINFLIGLGAIPLFDLDEGAFSSATMEMLARGDFITTYMGGELRFDKPILIYWLQAASVSSLGLTEFALRLPSALCASLWCWALFIFTQHYLDSSRAATASIFLAASLVVSVIARAATADALLNLWICLALFDGYRALTSAAPKNYLLNTYVLRTYLWVGLGVLTKGPVAILIPLAVSGLFVLFNRRWQDYWRLLFNPLGWVICLAVFLPWYIAEYLAQGQYFIDGFFLKHNLSRFTNTMEGHGGNIFYYLPISLLVFMPITGLFLQLVIRARRFCVDSLDIFCWCWFGFVLIFFSFSSTQLPHYILYGVTPIFILLARYRAHLQSNWFLLTPIVLLFAVFIFLPEIVQYLIDDYSLKHKKIELVAMLTHGLQFLSFNYRLLLVAALSAIVAIALLPLRLSQWHKHIYIAAIFSSAFIHVILPRYATIQQAPVQDAVAVARELQAPIVMWKHDMPSFSVYLGRVVPIRAPQAGEVVFTGLDQLPHFPNAHILFNRAGLVLVRMP